MAIPVDASAQAVLGAVGVDDVMTPGVRELAVDSAQVRSGVGSSSVRTPSVRLRRVSAKVNNKGLEERQLNDFECQRCLRCIIS